MEVIKNEGSQEQAKVETYSNPFNFDKLIGNILKRTAGFCVQFDTTILVGEEGSKYFFGELSKVTGKEFKPVNTVNLAGINMNIRPINLKENVIVVVVNNVKIEEYTF